jgi:hypothetical protein
MSQAPAIERFALLIGAMKAGTTALWHWLAQHPQIAASRVKEPQFLCEKANWEQGIERYLELWDWQPGRHRWALEASTNYSKLPVRGNAALAALRLPGEFRFLYMVRDPVARLRSQYLHSLAEGWIEQPIHAGLSPQAVLFSNYRFQLEPYKVFHGREAIHVISYEAFRADPRAIVRRVCAFLGIDPDFPFRDPGPQNSSDTYRRKLLTRILVERGVELPCCDPDERTAAEEELQRRITPSPAQVEELRALLGPDLELFAREWGVDPWAPPAKPAATPPERPAVAQATLFDAA